MRVLDISVDLGRDASPAQLETLVRAVRVATDVAYDSEFRRVRRVATDRMKYPTDDELSSVADRLGKRQQDRAYRHLQLRKQLGFEQERLGPRDVPPPGYWYDRLEESKAGHLLNELGYARYLRGRLTAPWAWGFGGLVGLDVVDPELYEALVAAELTLAAPGTVSVRSVRYQNPFGEEIVAVGAAAEQTLKATPGVIETVATVGSKRKIKKVQAQVAEATVEEQIEDVQLDIEIKREQLRAARIANDIADEEYLKKKIENAKRPRG